MGMWGSGNLESDGALDFVGEHIKTLVSYIESQLVPEKLQSEEFTVSIGDYQIMPTLEILMAILEGLDEMLDMEPERVEGWRDRYLQAFDRWAPHWAYLGNFHLERRQVIVETFERLMTFIS